MFTSYSKSFNKLTVSLLIAGVFSFFLTSCGSNARNDNRNKIIVSVKDQTMILSEDGEPVKAYKVSTSKFGLGNTHRSMCTPLGKMRIAQKIGGGAPIGAVFKSRMRTGEIIKPNAPGRDPIVSRILWLKGSEYRNRHTYARYIYIHGTPEESTIGHPTSYGCIRMKSRDIIDLYRRVGIGTEVKIVSDHLMKTPEGKKYARAKAASSDGA